MNEEEKKEFRQFTKKTWHNFIKTKTAPPIKISMNQAKYMLNISFLEKYFPGVNSWHIGKIIKEWDRMGFIKNE